MKRVERTATIATPPDELFAYLADLANLDEWMAGIVSAEVTSGGEIGVGTTARVVRALGSQSVEARLTVEAYEPHATSSSAARSPAFGSPHRST